MSPRPRSWGWCCRGSSHENTQNISSSGRDNPSYLSPRRPWVPSTEIFYIYFKTPLKRFTTALYIGYTCLVVCCLSEESVEIMIDNFTTPLKRLRASLYRIHLYHGSLDSKHQRLNKLMDYYYNRSTKQRISLYTLVVSGQIQKTQEGDANIFAGM